MRTMHEHPRLARAGIDPDIRATDVESWDMGGPISMLVSIERLDPFQTRGAPCFGDPSTEEDYLFLFGNDPEEAYQP